MKIKLYDADTKDVIRLLPEQNMSQDNLEHISNLVKGDILCLDNVRRYMIIEKAILLDSDDDLSKYNIDFELGLSLIPEKKARGMGFG